MQTVHDFLKQHQDESSLSEIDASAIVALDQAIELEESEIKDLKALRKEIAEPE